MQTDSKKLTNASGGGWQGAFMPIQNKKWRRIALAVLILVPVLALAWQFLGTTKPSTDMSTYHGKIFTFVYPRAGALNEYATGVVSVGNQKKDVYSPLVETVRYKSDPEEKQPASWEAFAKQQAQNLCGSDSAEKVTCSNVTSEPYTNPQGYTGLKLSMTMTRTNVSSGTSTAATYAPIYVLNTTQKPAPGETVRYEGVFIYHALPAFLSGSVSQTLMDQIVTTLRINTMAPQASPQG